MDLTERQLGRIEAALWGIEEATRNTNQTAARLARVIKEQIDEAEEAAQSRGEEDLREDLALQRDPLPNVPDWREKAVGQVGQVGQKSPESIRVYWWRHRLKTGPVELLRMIVRDFNLTVDELGDLLGIKHTSMWRILHGQQRDMMLARTAEFFGESGAAGSAADCRTGRTSQTGRTNCESEAEEE